MECVVKIVAGVVVLQAIGGSSTPFGRLTSLRTTVLVKANLECKCQFSRVRSLSASWLMINDPATPGQAELRGTLNSLDHFFGSLEGCVLGPGLFEDRDVGFGVFPGGEEVLIRSAGVGGVFLESVGAGAAEVSQRIEGA